MIEMASEPKTAPANALVLSPVRSPVLDGATESRTGRKRMLTTACTTTPMTSIGTMKVGLLTIVNPVVMASPRVSDPAGRLLKRAPVPGPPPWPPPGALGCQDTGGSDDGARCAGS